MTQIINFNFVVFFSTEGIYEVTTRFYENPVGFPVSYLSMSLNQYNTMSKETLAELTPNPKREYVAIAKNSGQISPDDWDVWEETLKLTDETTIGQIREWYLTKFELGQLDKDYVQMRGIRITQLSNPQP